MSSRLAKTHPSRSVTIPQQRDEADTHVAETQEV